MPTLVITGHPCVGKTAFAALLAERALKHKSGCISSAVIINEESACPDRTKAQCYEDSRAEKFTRGALKAEFDKHCTSNDAGERKRRLVILDSMNYIKGFRYELHCIAKALGERHGVVWVLCDAEVAKGWNRMRRKEREEGGKDAGYFFTDEAMEGLMQRYEPPDQRNRWDRPLYRVDVTSTLAQGNRTGKRQQDDSASKAAEDALKKSVYNMHSLSEAISSPSQSATSKPSAFKKSSLAFRRKAAPNKVEGSATVEEQSVEMQGGAEGPAVTTTGGEVGKMEDIIDEILDSFLVDVAPLKEGKSTAKPVTASANVLHEVDSITQRVSTAFLASQKSIAAVGSGRVCVSIGGGLSRTVELTRIMQLAEVKQVRRQYVKWIADHPPEDTSEVGIASSFLSYVEAQQ